MMDYDLIIVGGGLVGAGLAAALHDVPLRVALIDARLPDSNDPRLFALNSGSCHFLKNMGIWPQLTAYAAPIHQVHVSQRGHFGAVRLRREEAGLPTLGHVVPAKHIETALNDTLLTLKNVTLYRPATLVSLQQNEQTAVMTIKMATGECQLQAPVVIGADGTASTVREQAGIAVETVDYQQCAIVTRTTLSRSHEAIAYERFVNDGAIAMLPLTENECATIWSTNQVEADELMSLSDHDFLQRLQQTFGYRLGRLQKIAVRHHFPLRMLRAKQMHAGHVFLLGNAAHTIHPVAAQGFNLALYEVALLAEGIREKWMQGGLTSSDLASISERAQKQQAMSIGISHRLAQLFATKSAWLSILTAFGMTGLDASRPLKKKLMDSILGRTGSVPRLLMDVNG